MTETLEIRVLHHMARTGGTVISQCLGSMAGVVLLSEINPRGTRIYNPLTQARDWFGLLSEDDLLRLKDEPLGFVDAIALIHRRASERGKALVIRDWSHLDFTGVPFVRKPSYRLTTADTLRGRFRVIQTANVRHPVDQWLSLNRLSAVRGKLSLDEFLRGYRAFAERCREIGFIRYEDFARSPNDSLKKLCDKLKIAFDQGYEKRWMNYETLTTDPETKSHAKTIQPPSRAPIDPELLAQFEKNDDYRIGLKTLGYEHPC